jgi:uncharacterized protein (DUF488 family)
MLAGHRDKGKSMPNRRNARPEGVTIHTIGHSNHPIERFVALLASAGIERLIDVRSHPGSRFHPQFNRSALGAALSRAGIDYQWLGDRLGGKPKDPGLLDADGKPDYAKMAATLSFKTAIEALCASADDAPVAIMCAEEDPAKCHRTLLVGPALRTRDVRLLHIRGDGRVLDQETLDNQRRPAPQGQRGLFDET